MIDHYFRNLQDLITKTSFISTVNLQIERRSVTVGFVRGDLTFEDGSKLHFREYVHTVENEVVRFTYVYHLLSSNGNLIFRYDNTSHYPKLENAPHLNILVKRM